MPFCFNLFTNERLKELRKYLGLTQEEFAKMIGIKRNTLANYEIGRNEPIDAVFFSICTVFGVNEKWLRSGQGDMLAQSETFSLDEYAKLQNASESDFKLIRNYLSLTPEQRLLIQSLFNLNE